MLVFRSEDEILTWCARTGTARGEVVPFEMIWHLSRSWYGNRMSPDYRGRSPEEVEGILAAMGLASPFWQFDS